MSLFTQEVIGNCEKCGKLVSLNTLHNHECKTTPAAPREEEDDSKAQRRRFSESQQRIADLTASLAAQAQAVEEMRAKLIEENEIRVRAVRGALECGKAALDFEAERDRLRDAVALAVTYIESSAGGCRCETATGQCKSCRIISAIQSRAALELNSRPPLPGEKPPHPHEAKGEST